MQELINAIKGHAADTNQTAKTRHGIVSSYDPATYSVNILLQPEEKLTGWIPLVSPWVGNGWGMFCPPSIGDAVEVSFQEGDQENGVAGWRFYNDEDRPLPCPSGEFWLVHKSGSTLKFNNDGTITSNATAWNHVGNVNITGTLTASVDVIGGGKSLKNHTHGGVQAGSGSTGVPN